MTPEEVSSAPRRARTNGVRRCRGQLRRRSTDPQTALQDIEEQLRNPRPPTAVGCSPARSSPPGPSQGRRTARDAAARKLHGTLMRSTPLGGVANLRVADAYVELAGRRRDRHRRVPHDALSWPPPCRRRPTRRRRTRRSRCRRRRPRRRPRRRRPKGRRPRPPAAAAYSTLTLAAAAALATASSPRQARRRPRYPHLAAAALAAAAPAKPPPPSPPPTPPPPSPPPPPQPAPSPPPPSPPPPCPRPRHRRRRPPHPRRSRRRRVRHHGAARAQQAAQPHAPPSGTCV